MGSPTRSPRIAHAFCLGPDNGTVIRRRTPTASNGERALIIIGDTALLAIHPVRVIDILAPASFLTR